MATNNAVNVGLSGSTGTGKFVGDNSPSLLTPDIDTPSAGNLSNCTAYPAASLSGLGTGVGTALGQNVTGSNGIVLDTSPSITTPRVITSINDTNGNELIAVTATASAVNEITVANAATGNKPTLSATGGDTNIIFQLNGKGTGGVEIEGTSTNDNATAGYVGEFVSSTIAIGAPVAIATATATNLTSISLTAGDWDVWGNISFRGTAVAITTAIAGINTVSATPPSEELYSGIDSVLCSFVGVVSPCRRISLSGTTNVYNVGYVVFGAGTASMSGGIYARRVR